MGKVKDYFKKHKRVGMYGIDYLDKRLFGIMNDDLVLIGARSGAGKSTIANMIAQYNSSIGNKVVLFSLENFKDDDLITAVFYEYKKRVNKPFWKLRGFVSGAYEIDWDLIEEIEKEVLEKQKNIVKITRQKNFDLDKVKKMIIKYAEEGIKLFIIDHIDYIDNTQGENENVYMTALMQMFRDVQDAFNVAIVCISHLRKNSNARYTPKIPSMDEFIGSSNKTKQATEVIMLAPDELSNLKHLNDSDFSYRYTWCCIRKSRRDGVDNKAGNLKFDTKTGTYAPFTDNDDIYGVSYDGMNIYDKNGLLIN